MGLFKGLMKTSTLTLYLPAIAMTAQHSAAGILMSPYLDSLGYPVPAIGSLLSLSPLMALAARLPSGLLYRGDRAHLLMAGALTVIALCNIAYGYLTTPIPFALVMLLCFTQAPSLRANHSRARVHGQLSLARPLKFFALFLNPKMTTIVVVALFVNLVHQMGTAFFPLYGLSVGLSMTQVGIVRGLYALCNAVTRPLSGLVVKRLGRHRLSYSGIPMESLMMMLVPLFSDIGSLAMIFVIAGLLRAVVIVANAISVVEDVDETRVGRGMASGIYQAAGDLGNILGPSVGGVIASFTGIARLFFVAPPLIAGVFFGSLWANRFLGRRETQGQI